ncbi:kazrin-like isoform X2 [Symsagittifera roscoffensis]|uniref:kazrin-like isoform X2 n=1 Tax=Symsagittifera roscoffensis TaxID=84072 RepID=UPI00307B2B46
MNHNHNQRNFIHTAASAHHVPHGRSRSQGGSITESNHRNSMNHASPPILPPRSSLVLNNLPPQISGNPQINPAMNPNQGQFHNPRQISNHQFSSAHQIPQSIQPMQPQQQIQQQQHSGSNFNSYQRNQFFQHPSGVYNGSNNTTSIPHHGLSHSYRRSPEENGGRERGGGMSYPQEFVPSISRPSMTHQNWGQSNSSSQLRGAHHHQQQSSLVSTQNHQPVQSTSPAEDYYPSRQRQRNSSGPLNTSEKLPPKRPAPSQPSINQGGPVVTFNLQNKSPQNEAFEQLIGENKVLQSENSQMRQLLDSKATNDIQLQLLQKEVATANESKMNLRNDLFAATEKLRYAKTEQEKLVKTIDALNNELNSYRSNHAKTQDFCDQLASELDNEKKRIEELRSQNHNLSGDNESLKQENRDLRRDLERANSDLQRLKQELQSRANLISQFEQNCRCGAQLDNSDLNPNPQQFPMGETNPGANLGGFMGSSSPKGAFHKSAGSSAGNSDKSGSSGGAVMKRFKIGSSNGSNPEPEDCKSLMSSVSELPVESAETQGELQMLYTTPVTEWNAHLVEIFFKLHLKMSESFSTQAAQQIKSGKNLMGLTPNSAKNFLGIKDETQIKRVLVHIQVVCRDPEMPQDVIKYQGVKKMDHIWVANHFLTHLGLHMLCDHFRSSFVDMILLLTLNEKEIANLCAKAILNPKVAAKSIHLGIRMLRELDFMQTDFKRRKMKPQAKLQSLANERRLHPDSQKGRERETVGDLLVWSSETFMNWLKSIDFDDATVNKLKNTGINGCFIAYSAFSAKELAIVLELRYDNEDPTFRHLRENYDVLVEETRRQIKQAKKENSRKKKLSRQSNTISNTEGQRILQEQQQQQHNSVKRSLSNSWSKASRLIRRSGSRGSSRASSREGSQDRRSVASTGAIAMTRDSFASTSTGASHPYSVNNDFKSLSRPYSPN